MEYVYAYELCSLFFLFVILGIFFSKKQFPTDTNKFFAVIVVCGFLDISLDMLSALTIENALNLPFPIVQTVNATFYALQMMFPLGLLYYVSLIAGWQGNARNFVHWALIFPCFLIQVALASNPWTKLFFYVDPVTGYTRGEWFNLFYIGAGIYLFLTVIAIFVFRKVLSQLQIATILAAIAIIISAIIIQYSYPEYLLSGVAIAISIVMMYLVIHNPEHMLDSVTGAFNKEAIDFFMNNKSIKKKDYGIIVFDAIDFHKISNIFGAGAVKELVCQIGDFLINLAGKDGWVFRTSNHTFLIVLKNDEKFENAYNSIYRRCNSPWQIRGENIDTNFHLTRVKQIGDISSIESLMLLIKDSLSMNPDNKGVYITDNKGIYVTDIDSNLINLANRKILIEEALKNGLRNNNFEVHYQPIYSLAHGKFTQAEALLRLNAPNFENISPSEFIPIAEKSGLIFDIDELVISHVCKFLSENQIKKDLGLDKIEINLSGAEFIRKDLAETVASILGSYNVSSNQICIEITESIATFSFDSYKDIATGMKEKGFSFALDDYGTGYANVSQMVSLAFDIVKIDRSMLLSSFEHEKNATIFKHTVHMLKSLGIPVVVEGAEEKHHIDFLKELEVDFIQGYYYSKPLSESDFKKFLVENNS